LLKDKVKDILVAGGWSVNIASIILLNLYAKAGLMWLDYAPIFIVAVLAGLILVDPEKIVYGLTESILFSILIMSFCLVLPVTLGEIGHFAPLEAFYSGVIIMIFKGIFPTTIIVSLLGGFVGGLIGERLRLR